jgi:hypothetical protein
MVVVAAMTDELMTRHHQRRQRQQRRSNGRQRAAPRGTAPGPWRPSPWARWGARARDHRRRCAALRTVQHALQDGRVLRMFACALGQRRRVGPGVEGQVVVVLAHVVLEAGPAAGAAQRRGCVLLQGPPLPCAHCAGGRAQQRPAAAAAAGASGPPRRPRAPSGALPRRRAAAAGRCTLATHAHAPRRGRHRRPAAPGDAARRRDASQASQSGARARQVPAALRARARAAPQAPPLGPGLARRGARRREGRGRLDHSTIGAHLESVP